MSSATILLTDHPWPDVTIEREIAEAAGFRLVAGPSVAGTGSEIDALAERHRPDAILTCWAPVSGAAIAACPNLSVVARLGVGLDNIDVATATSRGVWVTNVPDYCVEEVSDHALALALAWVRGIVALDRDVKSGRWNPSAPVPLRRSAALTVGILGLGRIGRLTAAKMAAVGFHVIGHERYPSPDAGHVELVSADELARRADIVVVHLPLLAETQHFVGAGFLRQMKPGSFLVNVSRGPVVDSQALLKALDDGNLGGAGLDVAEGEPRPLPALIEHPRVIATPHVAYLSDVSLAELRRRATEEAVRVLKGEAPQNPANAPAGRDGSGIGTR